MPKFFFDGAFGTLYASRGGRSTICEEADIFEPDLVTEIHRGYIRAGANALKTNTYQANPLLFPDSEKLTEIISNGWRLARDAADGAEVFADIGNILAEPETAAECYLRTAEEFLRLGADRFLFETLDCFEPVVGALRLIREKCPEAVIITSFAAAQDGYTRTGNDVFRLISEALQFSDYVGMNCVSGPSAMLSLAGKISEKLPGFDFARLSLMPNASFPVCQNGRTLFSNDPEYFAERLAEMAALGTGAVGGCCGTTPEHMRLSYEKIRSGNVHAALAERVSPEKRFNSFSEHPKPSRRYTAVELNPPLLPDDGFFMECAHRIVAAGADALTVTDSPLARVRADPVILSAKLKRETGLPVIPHMTCRDRNRIAIKSSLIAASIEGIRDVLAITGDSPDEGLRLGGVKPVYNMSSRGLISYIDSMNGDVFSGRAFRIYAALNVNAVNFDAELDRAVKKLELGAAALMTQAIFTTEGEENLRKAYTSIKQRKPETFILAGVMPLAGYKNAVFLSGEVGGITIPEELVRRLKDASPDETRGIVIGQAKATIDRIWDCCDGFYLMFPLKRVELCLELLAYIRKKELGGGTGRDAGSFR